MAVLSAREPAKYGAPSTMKVVDVLVVLKFKTIRITLKAATIELLLLGDPFLDHT